MKMVTINNKNYEVINNEKDAIDVELLTERITDYYDAFDYIVGDYAYGKVRLKGFNEKTNKSFKPINDIKNLQKYIDESCAYGCKWFCIKKITNKDWFKSYRLL